MIRKTSSLDDANFRKAVRRAKLSYSRSEKGTKRKTLNPSQKRARLLRELSQGN